MIKRPDSPSALVAFTAAMLLSAFAVNAAEEAAIPKPAIELGSPFVDNAILQREMKVPVWGWSKPGTKVTVEFSGQKQEAKAGKDGKWMVELNDPKASFEPAEMVITESTGKKVTRPAAIKGKSTGIELGDWSEISKVIETAVSKN